MRRLAFGLVLAGGTVVLASDSEDGRAIDFSSEIKPILVDRCFACHGPDEARAGLRFSSREGAFARLTSGETAIVPGEPHHSELLRRVASADPGERMPPDGKPLSAVQIETLRDWIAAGAPWDDGHWAYAPLARPDLPPVRNRTWVRTPVDRFVLARLEAAGIAPSPEADRYTLIRRLSYDLLGLPVDPAEAQAFVNDAAPDAYERLVDRLLDSPHFGERWGRHWLDKARYADSDGYLNDDTRPHAWRYRDWVIAAINADLPFDRFTREQLAGDLMDREPDRLTAAGFHRHALTNKEAGIDKEKYRVETVFDRVETTATVWLGLTFNCARCHNHKYDQITQADYYQLFAFFNNADDADVGVPGGKVSTLAERKNSRETFILHRGEYEQPLDRVDPATPAVLPGLVARVSQPGEAESEDPACQTAVPEGNASAGRLTRLDLARWIVDDANPLTPRVAVNHVWRHLFGEGLVRTPDNFGVRGERPTHPELLEWLADEFRRRGWSRKQMIRLIVTSSAYRMGSHHRPELSEVDPENRLLHRQNRFRVQAEIIHDLSLAAGGLLAPRVGGPSAFPPLEKDPTVARPFKWETETGPDRYRRGMYTFFKRTAPYPNLVVFDCPDSTTSSVERGVSNTPLQALTTLNNQVFVDAARGLAARVLREIKDDDDARVIGAFRWCLGRPPTSDERRELRELVDFGRDWYGRHEREARTLAGDTAGDIPAVEAAAWTAVAGTLLNLDEFLTRE